MSRKGFTLVEILVTMAVGVILITFASLSLLGLRSKTAISTSVNTLVIDLRTQQLMAMTGVATRGAGLYFNPKSYVLFSGPAYDPNNGSNFTVNLDDMEVAAISYAQNTVFFAPRSGNASGAGQVTLKNSSTQEEKILKINSLGTVYE